MRYGFVLPGGSAREQMAQAGCIWWLDARWELPHHGDERMNQVTARLQAGPPVYG